MNMERFQSRGPVVSTTPSVDCSRRYPRGLVSALVEALLSSAYPLMFMLAETLAKYGVQFGHWLPPASEELVKRAIRGQRAGHRRV